MDSSRISLKELIEKGVLRAGTLIFAKSFGRMYKGTINQDGSITLETKNGSKEFPSPTSAARTIRKSGVNGWTFWKVQDLSRDKDLKSYRDQYEQLLAKPK